MEPKKYDRRGQGILYELDEDRRIVWLLLGWFGFSTSL